MNRIEILSFGHDDKLMSESYRIRFAVFVDEQKVPSGIEKDEYDARSTHVLAFFDGKPVATGRVFLDPELNGVARLGRVAVLREFRGLGAGLAVCKSLISMAEKLKSHKILIHAQVSVEGLYRRLGFERIGEEFLEAGIRHVEMVLELNK
ncbi:MAG: GNAT family N-acetyltransferase [Candidatus Rifleibacteriota bacterium]